MLANALIDQIMCAYVGNFVSIKQGVRDDIYLHAELIAGVSANHMGDSQTATRMHMLPSI
jgi:hypothetical protein